MSHSYLSIHTIRLPWFLATYRLCFLCFFPAIIIVLFYYQASIPALVYWAMINTHINCDLELAKANGAKPI